MNLILIVLVPSCSSEGAAIGDIGGGDNKDFTSLSLRRTGPAVTEWYF